MTTETAVPYWAHRPLADVRPQTPRPYFSIRGEAYASIFPEEWDPNDLARMQQAARLWAAIADGTKSYEQITTLERRRMISDFRWILTKLLPGAADYVIGGLSIQEIQNIVLAWNQFSRDYVDWVKEHMDIVAEAMQPNSPMATITKQDGEDQV